jgi:hypothetical protein
MVSLRAAPPVLPKSALPTLVDGSLTPEAIPDRLAYYHFIMATAITCDAAAKEVDRRESLLREVGFSKRDHDSFIESLQDVRDRLDQVTIARKQWGVDTTPARAALAMLKQQEKKILDGARSKIQMALTGEGLDRLDTHIREHVKRNIKIYGTGPQ